MRGPSANACAPPRGAASGGRGQATYGPAPRLAAARSVKTAWRPGTRSSATGATTTATIPIPPRAVWPTKSRARRCRNGGTTTLPWGPSPTCGRPSLAPPTATGADGSASCGSAQGAPCRCATLAACRADAWDAIANARTSTNSTSRLRRPRHPLLPFDVAQPEFEVHECERPGAGHGCWPDGRPVATVC